MKKSKQKFTAGIFAGTWIAILIIFLFLIMLYGCSSISTAPISKEEMFPIRPDDPTIGLIINYGTIPANLQIYNKVGKLIEGGNMYVEGADRLIAVNNRPAPTIIPYKLSPGCYEVEIYPFYYRFRIIGWERIRIDMPQQTAWVCVDKNVNAYYKGRYYGWLLMFSAGDIPKNASGFPDISINFQGRFWKDIGLRN